MNEERLMNEMREMIQAGLCPWCGRGPFIMPLLHVQQIHGMSRRETRDLIGCDYTESLTAPTYREYRSELNRRLIDEGVLRRGGSRHGWAGNQSLITHQRRRQSQERTRTEKVAKRRQRVMAALRAGSTIKELAEQNGVTVDHMSKYLRQNGVTVLINGGVGANVQPGDRTKRDTARTVILDVLKTGPQRWKEIVKIIESSGLTERTGHRARDELAKEGKISLLPDSWAWHLTEQQEVEQSTSTGNASS